MATNTIQTDVGSQYTDRLVTAAKARDTKAVASIAKEQGQAVATAVANKFTQSSANTALVNKVASAGQAAANFGAQSSGSTSAVSSSKASEAYATAQNVTAALAKARASASAFNRKV